jgi:hypothetical protein
MDLNTLADSLLCVYSWGCVLLCDESLVIVDDRVGGV